MSTRPHLDPGSAVVSVGNLAFGGRGKTPVAAGLALAAEGDGHRPAILIRGYGGRLRSGPLVLRAVASEVLAPWLAPLRGRDAGGERVLPAWRWAAEAGDEAPWLAAVLGGGPVGVHPDRGSAVSAVLTGLSGPRPDLWLLDDGFQNPVPRDLDVLLLDSRRDPPFQPRRLHREGPRAVERADLIGLFGPGPVASLPPSTPTVRLARRPGRLRRLRDGAILSPPWTAGLPVAGVGAPSSFDETLAEAGIPALPSVRLRDHRSPGPLLRRRLAARPDGAPLLTTEKDAVRWAVRCGDPSVHVLELRVEGVDRLWRALRERLDNRATVGEREVSGVLAPRHPGAPRRA